MQVDGFDLIDQSKALERGLISSVELLERQLVKIGGDGASLGAFVSLDADGARKAAQQSDLRRRSRGSLGVLDGITIAVKDMIATRGLATTANSRVAPGARYDGRGDAECVRRLRDHGAIILGKTTTFEYAAGLPDSETGFPIPRNPWDHTRTPSGSSSGSSIAVVTGMASAALGTDTGGSIRAPAAATGHTGLKPTPGLVPTEGVVPLSPTLDVVGPMARSARDCAAILDALVTPRGHEAGRFVSTPSLSLSGITVGIPREWFWDHPLIESSVRRACEEAVSVMRDLGATVRDVELSHSRLAAQANHVIVVSEAFAWHRPGLRARWLEYGRHTRLTLARGALLGGSDYVQAQRLRQAYQAAVAASLMACDVLVTPTVPEVAAAADSISVTNRLTMPNFVSPFNLAATPAISIPVGHDHKGLPIALQIVGRPHDDALILGIAETFQSHSSWHRLAPEVNCRT